MAAGGLHISISAETLFHIAGIPISNSMLTSIVASFLLIFFAVMVRASFSETGAPTGIQNFAEWLVEALHNLVDSVTGSKKRTAHFFPFIATFFLFIVLNNWLGLLPGVGTIGFVENALESHQEELTETHTSLPDIAVANAQETFDDHQSNEPTIDVVAGEAMPIVNPDALVNESEAHEDGSIMEVQHDEDLTSEENEPHGPKFVPFFRAGTADLNTTIALALFSQVVAQFFGFYYLGFGYLKKFFNFSNPILFFVGMLELLGELTKVVSYAFRLFGNIFAGEVLLAVIAFLIPVVVPMPFYGLELFVGMIQGLVFAMLSVVFFNMATLGHGDEH